MVRRWLSFAAVMVASLAFAAYGVMAETGPIGWLNYAQQSIFGAYSKKVSLLVALFGGFIVLALIWSGVERLARRLGFERALPSPAAILADADAPVTTRGVLLSYLVIVPLIWIAGYAIYWWMRHEARADATAQYEPITLARGPLAVSGNPYLALRGRLLWERTLDHTEGSSSTPDYSLVPIVEPDWQDGDPVRFVARIDNSNRYLVDTRRGRDSGVLLARTDGAVPVPAAQEFRKMRAPTSESASLLRLVPSQEGRPTLRDSGESDWNVYLILASIGTVLYVVFGTAIIAGTKLRQRRLAAGATQRRR